MSLYGDIPQAKDGSGARGTSWQQFKKQGGLKRGPGGIAAPMSILKKSKKEDVQPAPKAPEVGGVGLFSSMGMVQEEYDPARPNDYEHEMKAREVKRIEAAKEAERQAKLKEADEKRKEEEERAARERQRAAELAARGESGHKGMSLAQKLLEKMGWQQGQGLGKARQGITAPLVLQKTDMRAGVIVEASKKGTATEPTNPEVPNPPPASEPPWDKDQAQPPSRVVLLRNMVSPGEVDEQLEDEVAQECQKYGEIEDFTIFEATEAGFPDDQAVRIFVKLSALQAAQTLLAALDGRYFGGRRLWATYFNEARFDSGELAPRPEEILRG